MKITKRILSVMAAVLILTVSCLTAVVSADENTLTFNGGKTANVGDTITYTFSLSDSPEPLVGIQMYVYYNPEYLQASPEYTTDLTGLTTVNPSYIDDKGNGQVIVVSSDINGMDYSAKKKIISVDFTVLKGGESDITYYVTEMYTLDESSGSPEFAPLSAYTFHQDITVNGSSVSQDETPKLETDDSKFTSDQISSFVNNEEGKSDGQSTYVPSVEATTEGTSSNEGATTPTSSTEEVTDSNGQTVTQPTDENGQPITSADENVETNSSSSGVNIVLIIVIVAAVVVVIAVVLLFATKKKK